MIIEILNEESFMFIKDTEISKKLLFDKFFDTALVELIRFKSINVKVKSENISVGLSIQYARTLDNKKHYDSDFVVGHALARSTSAVCLQLVCC